MAAAAWFAWLLLTCAVTEFATELPSILRAVLCVLLATSGIHSVRVFVLLAGPRAVRAIEWNDTHEYFLFLGPARERHAATLARGTFRLGTRFWVLWFATASGSRSVLVEEAANDVQAFRRLSRRLGAEVRSRSGRRVHPADTIRPKV